MVADWATESKRFVAVRPGNYRTSALKMRPRQQQSASCWALSNEFRELLRLRGEKGTLRNQLVEGNGSTSLFDAMLPGRAVA